MPVDGRHILVVTEQGLGDCIASYELANGGANSLTPGQRQLRRGHRVFDHGQRRQ
jgi:hypothetical protein